MQILTPWIYRLSIVEYLFLGGYGEVMDGSHRERNIVQTR